MFFICSHPEYSIKLESELENYYPPRPSRIHEICGAGACSFVFGLSSHLSENPVIWIGRLGETSFHYDVLKSFGVVEKLYFINVHDHKKQLWCMEEVLASASVSLVICERESAVSFRDMRRLQLAAERGQTTGIFITSERFASPAAETRWVCTPLHDPQDAMENNRFQSWSLVKNKQGNLGQWKVSWDDKTHRFSLV